MGGMIAGLFFFRSDILRRVRVSQRPVRPQPRWPSRPPERRRPEEPPENNIDSILDKISAKGYENLTPTEKSILQNYSRQRKESSD
jgi:hypothetical protein